MIHGLTKQLCTYWRKHHWYTVYLLDGHSLISRSSLIKCYQIRLRHCSHLLSIIFGNFWLRLHQAHPLWFSLLFWSYLKSLPGSAITQRRCGSQSTSKVSIKESTSGHTSKFCDKKAKSLGWRRKKLLKLGQVQKECKMSIMSDLKLHGMSSLKHRTSLMLRCLASTTMTC